MKVSGTTLGILTKAICGEKRPFPYRTKQALINLFSDYPTGNTYEHGIPGKEAYVLKELQTLNGSNKIRLLIEEILNLAHFDSIIHQYESAKILEDYFNKDGYEYEHDTKINKYTIKYENISLIETKSICSLTYGFVNEQVNKCNKKILEQDYDGAITNARSLTESVMVTLIGKSEQIYNFNGDLNQLYKSVSKVLNLDPSRKDLSDTLKQILRGLISITVGISGISNKMGDRHNRQYKPSKHHAKLIINTAYTICEFLIDTYEYQNDKKVSKEA